MNKMKAVGRTVVALMFLVQAGCDNKDGAKPVQALFQQLPSSATGIDFNNKVVGSKDFNVFKYRNFYNGGGVAIGDVNNDGRPDVFFTSNEGRNRLYLNQGNWKFVDVTAKAGVAGIHKWHTGAAMADVNGDGWLDIYVSNSGEINGDDRANELYINNRNGTFSEQAAQYGLDDKGLGTHAAFFDYDHDGDLDCFILNNSYRPIESFGNKQRLRDVRDTVNGDKLLRNDHGRFVDVSAKAGIYGSEIGFGLGVSVGDVNNDGWDDIYVSNDFFERDYLYLNQHDGTFAEVLPRAMGHISMSSMGSDMMDINNDGHLDIFTTDMLPEEDFRLKTTTRFEDYDVHNAKTQSDFHHQLTSNCLQLNNGDGTFSEIAQLAGVDATDWSWGALGFDFDNDGWKDLFVSNGISKDLTDQDFLEYFSSTEVLNEVRSGGFDHEQFLRKMRSTPVPNYAFLNKHDLGFRNISVESGLGMKGFSNGAAYGDLDGDGDLDLVVNNENMEAFVFRNTTTETLHKHFLKVRLEGLAPNTQGVGARVAVHAQGMVQVIEQMPTRGFESSVDPVLNFGIGDQGVIDSVVVSWTNMKSQVLLRPHADTTITLHQAEAKLNTIYPAAQGSTMYQNVTGKMITGDIRHKENLFVDFDRQWLIPKMLSTEGPKLSVGDVNGDGKPDVFMGGARQDTAKLFLSDTQGKLNRVRQFVFEQDKDFEDAGSTFVDVDRDGDLDLVVASGGNEGAPGTLDLLARLYINDGKGNFTHAAAGWPLISINASCVQAFDYDGDGFSDLFIGARSIPGSYGRKPNSILLHNEKGHGFTDVTLRVAPELMHLGMVTAAQWMDLGHGEKGLVIVGDWMPVTVFKMKENALRKAQELPHSSGWWNCLVSADIDGDGDLDLVAGNTGLNWRVKPDPEHPARLYVGDFNKNGKDVCIPVYYKSDGKAYPAYLLNDMLSQMPYLKKKFIRFDAYAGKGIEDVFTPDELSRADMLRVEQSRTCVFVNNGSGAFTMTPLPVMAQLTPIFGIYVGDLNGDGRPDLFMGGNFHGLKPEVGRMDAGYGTTFLGGPSHDFNYVPTRSSGLFIQGEVRDIKAIPFGTENDIIVARNNEELQIFEQARTHPSAKGK